MEGAGIEGWQTSTSRNFTWESHYPGFYSVNLRANNSAGSDWENKTNYVIISANATPNNCDIEPISGYVRTYAQTNDGMTSGGIFNSNIQMNDVEGGAWSNVTNSGGWWCIDTLPLHSLNLYAQATGYTSVSSLGLPANGGRHYLVMWPDYIATPSAGNVTLYVLVYDQQTGAPLYLSSVRVDGTAINTVLKNTGPEGQAMFTIKNDSSVHITASKSGYSTITKVITTSHLGPDTVMISLPRATITGAPTASPTPSWMTTAPTVGPGPQGTMPAGYTNTQGQIMMDFLARNGLNLVELCFMVTILALLGVKLGK
jgi:PKD repeat protein